MSSLTARAIMDGNNLVTFELDHTVEVKLLDELIEFRFELVLGVLDIKKRQRMISLALFLCVY